MDLPVAGVLIPIPDDFPHQILPFPDPSNLLYINPTPVIHPQHQHIISDRPIPPPQPQKLRPIRFSGRSPANSQVENGGLGKLRGVGSPDTRYEDRIEYFDSPVQVSAADLTENNVLSDGVGNGFLSADDKKKMDTVAETSSPSYGDFLMEEESSSSPGCSNGDSVADMGVDRRRKRRRTRKMEHFLEKMAMKVMERQEQMHRQLIEIIEKREAAKQVREEAWKKTEIERTEMDEKFRAQEMSRSLHLISLIENLSGHEIPIPRTIRRQFMEEEDGDSGV